MGGGINGMSATSVRKTLLGAGLHLAFLFLRRLLFLKLRRCANAERHYALFRFLVVRRSYSEAGLAWGIFARARINARGKVNYFLQSGEKGGLIGEPDINPILYGETSSYKRRKMAGSTSSR